MIAELLRIILMDGEPIGEGVLMTVLKPVKVMFSASFASLRMTVLNVECIDMASRIEEMGVHPDKFAVSQ